MWWKAITYALKRDNDDLARLLSSVVGGSDAAVNEVTESQYKEYFAFTDVLQQVRCAMHLMRKLLSDCT